MSDQIEEPDDDSIPPVHISLRNTTGGANEVTLSTPLLGLAPYALITIGDEGFEVEGSHMTLEDLASLLGIVASAALLADGVDPEIRAGVIEILKDGEATDA